MPIARRHQEQQGWLKIFIERSAKQRLCTKMRCTTCGAMKFRQRLVKEALYKEPMTLDTIMAEKIGVIIADELARLERNLDWKDAVMLIVFELDSVLPRDKLKELLQGSWAGELLYEMEEHYRRRL